jgi:hypothetical protein
MALGWASVRECSPRGEVVSRVWRRLPTIWVVEEPADIDLVAASLRADADDLRVFVETLATKLEQSFPGRCRVGRAGLLGKGSVRQISVAVGESRYELMHDNGAISTRRSSVVRGISLKSEELGLDEWIDSLAAQMVAEAGRSERGRLALERLVSVDPTAEREVS